jgi:hypothetical protein
VVRAGVLHSHPGQIFGGVGMKLDEEAWSGGRLVGRYITDDRGLWLCKRVDPRKHQLKTPPAWAIDAKHLSELARRGGIGVRLLLTTGEVLEATLEDFAQWGFDIRRPPYETQMALTLNRWSNHTRE